MFYLDLDLDLDRFKPVNDQLGHDAGDELLIAVAQRLTNCTRSTDTVARLGGDEFAILIGARTTLQDTDTVADRLAQAFTEPFAITTHELRVDASLGRATFPADAGDAENLLRAADGAMFTTKRARHQARQQPARSG